MVVFAADVWNKWGQKPFIVLNISVNSLKKAHPMQTPSFGTKYSRIDQVKFVEDSL